MPQDRGTGFSLMTIGTVVEVDDNSTLLSRSSRRARLIGYDYVRFLAILMVTWQYLATLLNQHKWTRLGEFSIGPMGVALFLAIGGALANDSERDPTKRLRRIVRCEIRSPIPLPTGAALFARRLQECLNREWLCHRLSGNLSRSGVPHSPSLR